MDEAEAFLGGGGTEGDDEELAEHRLEACQVSGEGGTQNSEEDK